MLSRDDYLCQYIEGFIGRNFLIHILQKTISWPSKYEKCWIKQNYVNFELQDFSEHLICKMSKIGLTTKSFWGQNISWD